LAPKLGQTEFGNSTEGSSFGTHRLVIRAQLVGGSTKLYMVSVS